MSSNTSSNAKILSQGNHPPNTFRVLNMQLIKLELQVEPDFIALDPESASVQHSDIPDEQGDTELLNNLCSCLQWNIV